jgi:hypothetical protein
MLRVTHMYLMLSVIMLNVIILSVMAPSSCLAPVNVTNLFLIGTDAKTWQARAFVTGIYFHHNLLLASSTKAGPIL